MRIKYLKAKDGKRLNVSRFSNFSVAESVKGVKDKYYGKNALLVSCGSWIYYDGNLDHSNN